MKPFTPNIIISLLLLWFLHTNILRADNKDDKNKVKYRVTAVKQGEISVVSESNIVEINIPLSIYIPNTFTPNGDDLNDVFKIAGDGIAEFQMNIYNKWGKMIFESANINEHWDGTCDGALVPDGAYVYDIYLKTSDEKFFQKRGSIMVVK